MEVTKCVSAMDFVKDWKTWRATLKEGIQGARKLGVSDETIQTLATKVGDFLVEKVCPATPEEEVLKERAKGKETGNKRKKVKRAVWIGSLAINIIFVLVIINALKPVPFTEEDWLIITDFENLTGDDVFNQSLNAALEVGIQQSSFVNVFPRSRINETLQRMGKENVFLI